MIKNKKKVKNGNIVDKITVSKIQRELLYRNGCTRYDISNYRNGKFHFIKNTKIKLMTLILKNEIIDAKEVTPLSNKCYGAEIKYWIIFRGLE